MEEITFSGSNPESLWYEYLDQSDVPINFSTLMSEAVQYGDATLLDDLRSIQERGLDMDLLQDEGTLEQLQSFCRVLVAKRRAHPEKGELISATLKWARDRYYQEASSIDASLAREVKEDDTFEDARPEVSIINYLTYFVEKMSPRTLFKSKNRLFELRKADKLSYDLFVKAMLLVLEQIVLKCHSDKALLDKFQEMSWQLQTVQTESVWDVSVGENNLGESELVEAIDIRRAARRVSARHNVSFEEACQMLYSE